MLARAEIEPIYFNHDHTVYESVSVGPDVFSSLDSHPYPTKIIMTDVGIFNLEHYSQFEAGYEGFPNRLVKYYKDKNGVDQEEVLFEFERRNSSLPDYYEFELVSGQDLSRIDRSEIVGQDDATGILGRVWAKRNEDLWKYFAYVLTGHEKYAGSLRSVVSDISVISFLTNQIMPVDPDKSRNSSSSNTSQVA